MQKILEMITNGWVELALTALLVAGLAGCGPGPGEPQIDMEKILSQPKTYVGSKECKVCHLEHYDSWRNTLHSRTLQNVTQNLDALIAESWKRHEQEHRGLGGLVGGLEGRWFWWFVVWLPGGPMFWWVGRLVGW